MSNEERFNVVGMPTSETPDTAAARARSVPQEHATTFSATADDTDSLREYIAVVARHKLVVALCAVVTPLAAFAYSSTQEASYEASASVLANAGSAGNILREIPGIGTANDPERLAATHVSLARLPVVAERTVEAAGLSESGLAFLGRSSVFAETDTDILRFVVEDGDPDQARRLATAYAQEFTAYRNELDVEALRSTRASITQTMATLAEQGQTGSALYAELSQALRRLDTAEAVRGSAAVVVQPSTSAVQVGPRTKRNAAIGLVLGLLYGLGFAFLIERLDTRIRTAEHVEATLALPALGELPKPPNLSKAKSRVAMLEMPYGAYAESVRKLRANLEFASVDSGLGVLMVTSSVPGEGKTTVAADLAVAFARSGRKVALCDLDARAPSMGRSLGIENRRGLVEIVLGLEALDQALIAVPLPSKPGAHVPIALSSAEAEPTEDAAGQAGVGQLRFLPFGVRRPHEPGDFVSSEAVRRVIARLRETHDLVVVDTAPLLPVSDARAVSEYVDAAIVVCGLRKSSKTDLRKVRRLLAVLPSRVFGVVVTGVPPVAGYGVYGEFEAPPEVDEAEAPRWASPPEPTRARDVGHRPPAADYRRSAT